MNQLMQSVRAFATDESGSEVVEYALIIALVSIVLALALGAAGLETSFAGLATRVTACFADSTC